MENTQLSWHERGQLWLRLGLRGALALGAAALLIWVGLPLASLLSPFLCALVLAWLLNPAVRWLQRKTNVSRPPLFLSDPLIDPQAGILESVRHIPLLQKGAVGIL